MKNESMLFVGGLAALGLAGCEDPLPPLEDVRIELARLDHEPLPVGWAPQATVVVSEALLEDLIARAALSQAPIPDVVARPFGFEVKATPRVGTCQQE